MANDVTIDIEVETKSAQKSIKKLEKSFTDFSKSAKSGTENATKAFDVFKGVVAAQAVIGGLKALGSAAFGIGAGFVKSAAQIEGLTSQLTTLTGSATDAANILVDLQQFAASTPFQLPGLAETTKKLLSFGFSQEEIIPKLKELGDVAAGSGADLGNLALIFGQVNAAGKLTGERLLQLQERAIPIGPALAKTMGVAETAVRDLVSEGKVSFDIFEKAFASLSAEGGQFFEGMVRQSKTFDGVVSTLSDNIDLVSADIGEGLLPEIKGLGIAFIGLIQSNKPLIASFKEFAATGLTDFINGAIQAIVPLGDALIIANNAFRGLLQIVDIVRIAFNELAGIFIVSIQTILEGARAVSNALGIDTSGLDSAIESFELMKEVSNETTEELVSDIVERNKAQKSFAKSVSDTAKTVQDSLQSTVAAEREKTKVVVEETTKRKAAVGFVEPTEQEAINAQVIALEQAKSDKLIEVKANEIFALREIEAAEAARKLEEKEIKQELDTGEADARLENLVLRLGEEEAIMAEAEARRLDKEGLVSQARKKRDSDDLKAKKAGLNNLQKFEQAIGQKRVSIASNTANLLSTVLGSENKAAFLIAQGAALAKVAIDRGAALSAVPAQTSAIPFPGNLAAAAKMATAININSGLQAATIAAATIKGFQGGGIVPGIPTDQDNQLATVASGEVILNRRQTAETLFQIANGGGGGGGGGGIVIQMGESLLGPTQDQIDGLIDQINDRTEFGNAQIA